MAKLSLPTLLLLLLLITIVTATSATTTNKDKCNPSDKKALLKIKSYFNNAYIFSSWTSNTDCCTWSMVKCDSTKNNRITSISINNDDLPGTVPSIISDLPYLKYMIFTKLPNLTGSIPESITKLQHLEMLWLSSNSLSGPLPTFLHKLPKLNYINLSFNKFSGTIPPSLALVSKLDYLRLDRNQLTGSIPESFGSFKIKDFYGLLLSHNQLTGTIPKSLGNMRFTVLDLSRNKLTGDASFLFKKVQTVQQLDLSRNLLHFDMTKVTVPENVTWLLLDHNKLYGSLPVNWAKIQWQNMNVSYNMLCGKIPSGGNLNRFDQYSYFHNKCLCGKPLASCK